MDNKPDANGLRHATTSVDLWRILNQSAGLDPGDYDLPIITDLARALNLPGGQLSDETLTGVPVEQFVDAFLDVSQPYVQMWRDLLALFEKAGAHASDTNLLINYDFDSTDGPLCAGFDLEHFKRTLEISERLLVSFDLSNCTPTEFWKLTAAFGPMVHAYARETPLDRPDIGAFVAACHNSGYPEQLPRRPDTRSERLEPLLAELWDLLSLLLRALRDEFRSYAGLNSQGGRERRDERTVAGLTIRNLWYTEHDHWLPTIVETTATRVGESTVAHLDEIADLLDQALAPLRGVSASPQQRLEDFLDLPLWKYRHELYSNWVATAVVTALEDQSPRVHSHNGAIRFAFSGTHLATFDGLEPRVHLWTELRSSLHDPVGEGRTSAIQPDIVLRTDPLTANHNPLVVECKQYKKANNRGFGDALTDYARGHPDATIVLADYGKVRGKTVAKYIPDDLRERTIVVSEMRPGQSKQVLRFHRIVRQSLRLTIPHTEVSLDHSNDAPRSDNRAGVSRELDDQSDDSLHFDRIVLTWATLPRDLDLHVLLKEPPHHICYRSRGTLDTSPFIQLRNDDTSGDGCEVAIVGRWLSTIYRIEVHNYSNESEISSSAARIDISIDGNTHTFRCPSDLDARTWNVCSIDGPTLTIFPTPP